jgi:SAM-dependent methyltransferase
VNREELRQYIVDNWSDFLALTKKNCESYHESMTIKNHEAHNKDLDYHKYMLGIVSTRPEYWKGKKALDFGCGCGRNVKNLLEAAEWERVDGCDISKKNADYTKKYVSQFFAPERCKTWETDGYTLSTDAENEYDFVMSHIVFQHIANWHMRYSILADMYKALKPGGVLNIHFMDLPGASLYHDSYPPVDMTASEFLEECIEQEFKNVLPLTADHKRPMEEKIAYFKETFGDKEWLPVNCIVGDPNYVAGDLYGIGFRTVGISTVVDPYSKQNAHYIGAFK